MKAELKKGRIWLTFPYSEQAVRRVKTIPGRSWNPTGRAWTLPLNLKTAQILVETFGRGIDISDELRAWSKQAVKDQRRLRKMAIAQDGNLKRLAPEFAEWLRPYQRADVAFMSERSCVNANQPGLGKTTTTVAAALEANVAGKPILIVSPVTSLDTVWLPEIAKQSAAPTPWGVSVTKRKQALEEALDLALAGQPVWVLVNPETLKTPAIAGKVARVFWGAAIIDEFQAMGLSNPKTLLAAATRAIKADRKWALSGTPVGGVPMELWAILNWLDPKTFSSRWAWAEQWLECVRGPFGIAIGGIQPGREREFYEYHAPWLIRRLKSEVAPELPPKRYRNVWVKMRPAQARQYEQFELDAEIRLSGQRMIATSKLAEWQRLKLMAFGSTRIAGDKHLPTFDSPKLRALLKNVRAIPGQHLVFSQYRRVTDVTAAFLENEGLEVAQLDGQTKNRAEIVAAFQRGEIDVLVIVTKAAGVSITLDAADTVHMLDQTWNPNDQEQAEDRAHRISRIHQVTVLVYRTRGTIDELVAQMNLDKIEVNAAMLDEHRAKLLHRQKR